jgi:hypothetical protein
MTVTLDGKSLNLTSRMALREAVTSVKVEWDDWENAAYTRKLKVLGKVRVWTIECYEKGVTWTNSAAKYFQGIIDDDASVTFVVSESDMHAVNTSVYVLSCEVRYEEGVPAGAQFRNFSITLQEA